MNFLNQILGGLKFSSMFNVGGASCGQSTRSGNGTTQKINDLLGQSQDADVDFSSSDMDLFNGTSYFGNMSFDTTSTDETSVAESSLGAMFGDGVSDGSSGESVDILSMLPAEAISVIQQNSPEAYSILQNLDSYQGVDILSMLSSEVISVIQQNSLEAYSILQNLGGS